MGIKKAAPFYNIVTDFLNKIVQDDYEDIVSLNRASLSAVCGYLNIQKNIMVLSEMGLDIESVQEPADWLSTPAGHLVKSISSGIPREDRAF